MAQLINLYQTQFHDDRKRFSAKVMLHTTVAAVFVLAGIAAYNGWQILTLQHQSTLIRKQLQSLTREKSDLEQKLMAGRADPVLAEKVQRMEKLMNSRRQLRASLQDDLFNGGQGYSRYLAALARQQISGLWLTDITLTGAGRDITLKGKTVNPVLLPNYLQNLSSETLLQGKQFRVFQLNLPVDQKKSKGRDALEFLVATSNEAGVSRE